MKHRFFTLLLIWATLGLGLSLVLAQADRSGKVQAQNGAFCPPGEAPHFIHGFAFLKTQLGQIMGDPLECEHYDAAGNAYQQTTTGQAFYDKQTNTPLFSSGSQHWAWTTNGLKQWEAASTPTAGLTASLPLRVMSYNILFGAGATSDWERRAAHLQPFAYPGNRLPDILAVIKAAAPDILGIQEAAGWTNGSPAIVEQVAAELGLTYHYLAPTPSGLHLVLLSKYKLVETENLSASIGNIGALRATLLTPQSQRLHVFVVHLDPFSAAARAEQITRLTQEMAPYLNSSTLLMGDTNVACLNTPDQCQAYQLLTAAGWQLVAKEPYLLNQIWTSPQLVPAVQDVRFPGANFGVSDHLPVGAVLNVVPSP